jgi:glycosyltransferase involved in cell wall biosynthesis
VTSQPQLLYLSLETPREGQATYTHVHEIIRGLRKTGWTVDLLATSRGGASSGSSYLTRLIDYVRVQWRAAQSMKRYDAVFMRAHFAAMPLSAWAKLRGVPVFQEINGLPADILVTYRWLRWIGPLIRWLYRSQMQMAAHVFVVTEGLRGWALAEVGHDRISVVTNGADIELFKPDGERPTQPERYIAFVGGLTAWHGIATMIAATKEPAWPEDLTLVIIGDGVERDLLKDASAHPRVSWLGRRQPKEVASYLRGAIAALSITEDSAGHLNTGVAPLKLFEAMASGVPVIVTDLPFQGDVVRTHETGIVIPMASPSDLAQAAASLAHDADLANRQGRNGRNYVERHASWQRRAEEISVVLEQRIGLSAGLGRSHPGHDP